MGSVARVHFWNVVNDDTMDSGMVQELIRLLEVRLAELKEIEEPKESHSERQ